MTTAQVVETSVTVNNNSPIQGYVHPDDQTQPTFEVETKLFLKCDSWSVITGLTKLLAKSKALEIYFRKFCLKSNTRNFNQEFLLEQLLGCP